VLRELPKLREEASRLAERLARLRLRAVIGQPPEETLRKILKEHRLSSSSDGIAQARETLQEALGKIRAGRAGSRGSQASEIFSRACGRSTWSRAPLKSCSKRPGATW
jgi:hypothetical protein